MRSGIRAVAQRRHVDFAARLAFIAALVLAPHEAPAGELEAHVLQHQGRRRLYHLLLPAGHDRARPVPLVIALHGGGGTGSGFDDSTRGQFAREVARRGWIVAFPEGVGRGWNDGRPLTTARDRARAGVDDVDFLRNLIAHLAERLGIDRTRVYATGISNGGFMSVRLGLELSDLVVAVAPVTATLPKVHDGKQPAHPVGLMLVNGTDDPLVPYEGGAVRVLGRTRGDIFSTDETVHRWVGFAGCTGAPGVTRLDDRDPGDGTRTVVTRWARCEGGAEVALYRVDGGGHTWPGGRQYLPPLLIGRVARDFEAAPAIFDFFARQRRSPLPARRHAGRRGTSASTGGDHAAAAQNMYRRLSWSRQTSLRKADGSSDLVISSPPTSRNR